MIRKKIKDFDTALRVYYANPEIGNKEMVELFGSMSTATKTRLKKEVKDEMAKRGVKSFRDHTVNTKVAYEVWGIDITEIEKRRAKLIKLGLA